MKIIQTAFSVFALSALLWIGAASAIEVGENAPGFELPSTQGGKFALSSFKGKKNVLIEFYVLDFTPT